MKIKSSIVGELEINEENIITFPDSLPGLPDDKKFFLMALEEGSSFFYLHSLENPDLCLLMADPFNFFSDYEIKLSPEALEKIQAEEENDRENIVLYCILNSPQEISKTTANLLAPILVNKRTKLGLQYIPEKSDYNIKHFIFPQNSSEEKKLEAKEGL